MSITSSEITREKTAISIGDYSLLKPVGFVFRRINQDGTMHSEHTIQQIFTHPEYKSGLRGHDIALLKLTQPIADLAGLTPNFNTQPNTKFDQCIAVGFGMKGERDGWFMSRDNIKRAIPVRDVFTAAYSDANYYCAVNGFCLGKTLTGNLFLEPTPHNPAAVGLTMGNFLTCSRLKSNHRTWR